MAGRAGRRGLDSTGTVIILAKGPEPPDIASLKSMLNGKPIALESRFRLTYGMLLNLLRVEQLRIEDMLQRSYVERASLRAVVTRKAKLKEIDDQIDALPAMECGHCAAAAPSPPPPAADGTASATATNCCPTMPAANADDSVPTTSSSSSMASVRLYFETVLGYADALATTWPLVVQRGREDKLFAPGRVVVVHYTPLSIVGRLAVVLKARFTDAGGHFLLTLFVPNSGDKFSEFGQRHKAYDALSEEDKKWHRNGLLLSHAALHGPEGVVPAHAFAREAPFTILEDVGLDSLTAVCRRSIAKLSVDTVLEEHRRISGPYRAQSPDRAVRRLLIELETLSDRFEQQQQHLKKRDMSELVYVLGQDTDRRDVDMVDRLREVRELRAQLVVEPEALFPCLKCPQIGQHLRLMAQRCKMEEQKRRLAFETSSNNLQFSKEYVDRLKVLQALHYIDRHNMVGLKGKVACEISNQELLITELILDNKFEQRSAAQIAAMLSSITCQFEAKNQNNAHGSGGGGGGGGGRFQRDNAPTAVAAAALAEHQQQQQQNERVPERMDKALLKELEHDVIAAANRIDAVQRQYGVANSPVVDELKFGLMEVVHQWATGMEFADIMRLTDAQEGIIVRCIQRLDEVCKDVRKAARIVGDPALFEKMGETSAAIRRDIVFAASLYTTEEE
ncbi:hypothetical protein niasHT_024837 [Heterodera trifolii]|uniref:ATP-dependent RNA helicase Ski2/MTR4 C-terminal domain-containing protein n=1 Tax=Heterodera trifolii TaxID=157864 RepID=A0ABD2JWG0_9BILA